MYFTLLTLVIIAIIVAAFTSLEMAIAIGAGAVLLYSIGASCGAESTSARIEASPTLFTAPPPSACRAMRSTTQSDDESVVADSELAEAAPSTETVSVQQPPKMTTYPTYRTHEVVRKTLKPLLVKPPEEGPLAGALHNEQMKRGNEVDGRSWGERMAALQKSMAAEITTEDGYMRPIGGKVGCKVSLGIL